MCVAVFWYLFGMARAGVSTAFFQLMHMYEVRTHAASMYNRVSAKL